MSPDATRAAETRPVQRRAFVTLLRGKGSPRLYPRALLAGLAWSLLIAFLYPYALDIAGAAGNLRYLGLALLLLVGFAAYRALRAFGRVIWHLGLIWLMAGFLILFLALTTTRMRAGASRGWSDAAGSVAGDVGAWLERRAEQLATAPADIYFAATGQAPPWRPKPRAVLDPVTLDRTDSGEQQPLLSESEPDGITRGVLVQIVAQNNSALNLRASANAEARSVAKVDRGALMIVVDGPQRSGDMLWWKVSAPDHEGWCAADTLVLVSR